MGKWRKIQIEFYAHEEFGDGRSFVELIDESLGIGATESFLVKPRLVSEEWATDPYEDEDEG